MERDYNILRFFSIIVAVVILNSCFLGKEEENPLDLPDYSPTLAHSLKV